MFVGFETPVFFVLVVWLRGLMFIEFSSTSFLLFFNNMYLISQACRNDELVIKNHFSPNVLHSEPDIVYDFLTLRICFIAGAIGRSRRSNFGDYLSHWLCKYAHIIKNV